MIFKPSHLRRREIENMLLEKPFKSELKALGGVSAAYEVIIEPENKCTWYHGDKQIDDFQIKSGKYQIRSYGEHRRLIVNNMKPADFTSISCVSRGQRLIRFLSEQAQEV